jgi:hypothetical protein
MTPRFPSKAQQRASARAERNEQLLDEVTTDTSRERMAPHHSTPDGHEHEIVVRIRIRPRTIITVGVAFAIGVLCGMSMEAQAMHAGIPADTGSTFSTLDR